MTSDLSLGLLVSGNLGLQVLRLLIKKYKIESVFTDQKSEEIINFASSHKIKLFVGNPREGRASEFIKGLKIDILLSVNYLFLIEKDLISLPKKYAINIHGSLLPKYRGRTPHVWAIINNEKFAGITAHLIDEGCDSGNIIEQIRVPIKQNDTGNDILIKYQKLYPKLINRILKKAARGKLKTFPQDDLKATCFGKRIPEDGQVDWNWQKERIYNWVRALAHPYPGAFTYHNKIKFIFHKLSFSDLGFSYDQPNGLVLQAKSDRLFVKTSNGVIVLEKLEKADNLHFCPGDILK